VQVHPSMVLIQWGCTTHGIRTRKTLLYLYINIIVILSLRKEMYQPIECLVKTSLVNEHIHVRSGQVHI
jgi:hypothetical protein